ncbi:2-amino-2-deoxy-isochorismate hydrolase PhzD [[Actinomadura] parvosata subsp. kistnae]|uniref:Isochorismatase n=1 Tax=[Actinomadura] parvosata subsp. kistnae TaxID=1909395 RepID=A0A1U9ZZQ3_9ACTN|nr:isochorismatase family protein [Nonomuraea sp. ATCC 55076]AQZ63400.1 isochorismatase [Nonomuraea sp. ATCC 55076]SPL99118.1 2-amino-2-deoxy-isochorismate hydrolase PhzD [Actinomadura parvosata subsp. kistnae]
MPGIPAIEPYPLPTAGDLPRGPVPWIPDPARAVLLVHDMQRYFVNPFPSPTRDELVRGIALLRSRAAALGVPVGYTAQPGSMTEEERGLLKDFWGPGMRSTPADRLVVDELAPEPGDWMFTKWRYSAFFRSDLLERMRRLGRDQLIVCGVYAHVGVLMTAVDAFTNDLETFLVGDAVADFNADYHRMALEYAAERCAAVVTAKEVFT